MHKLNALCSSLVLVASVLAGTVPAEAQWGVVKKHMAGTATGKHLIVYLCNEAQHKFTIITPVRLPMVGALPYKRFHSRYSVDGNSERPATLFLRGQDLSKPEYIYSMVLDTRGMQTKIADVVKLLASSHELELDLWSEKVTFSLRRADQAMAQVDRNCR